MSGENKPLYEDNKLVIDYLEGSAEDYEICIKDLESRYILPRGTLKDLAVGQIDKVERKVKTLNQDLFYDVVGPELGMNYFGSACSRAFIEEKRRIASFINENSP